MKKQGHFLQRLERYRALVNALPLTGRTVIDIGMGHGEVTRLLLDTDVSHVIGFEIDATLPDIEDPRLNIVIGDIREHESTFPQGAAVVSNPPYFLLPYLWDLFERKGVEDIVLMVPASKGVPAGFDLVFTLEGNAFDPPAEGSHLVVRKGFRLMRGTV